MTALTLQLRGNCAMVVGLLGAPRRDSLYDAPWRGGAELREVVVVQMQTLRCGRGLARGPYCVRWCGWRDGGLSMAARLRGAI